MKNPESKKGKAGAGCYPFRPGLVWGIRSASPRYFGAIVFGGLSF